MLEAGVESTSCVRDRTESELWRVLLYWVDDGGDEVQVSVIRTQVMRIVVIDGGESLADPWQYPPLHGPLLRADPGVVVVYPGLGELDDRGEPSGIPQGVLGPKCHLWEPKSVPRDHTLPSPQGILIYHHGAGIPGSPLLCRRLLRPGWEGEGVPLSGQALGKQKERRVWVMTHGMWGEFCSVRVTAVCRWLG